MPIALLAAFWSDQEQVSTCGEICRLVAYTVAIERREQLSLVVTLQLVKIVCSVVMGDHVTDYCNR
jgi:hypothetical protein